MGAIVFQGCVRSMGAFFASSVYFEYVAWVRVFVVCSGTSSMEC